MRRGAAGRIRNAVIYPRCGISSSRVLITAGQEIVVRRYSGDFVCAHMRDRLPIVPRRNTPPQRTITRRPIWSSMLFATLTSVKTNKHNVSLKHKSISICELRRQRCDDKDFGVVFLAMLAIRFVLVSSSVWQLFVWVCGSLL